MTLGAGMVAWVYYSMAWHYNGDHLAYTYSDFVADLCDMIVLFMCQVLWCCKVRRVSLALDDPDT